MQELLQWATDNLALLIAAGGLLLNWLARGPDRTEKIAGSASEILDHWEKLAFEYKAKYDECEEKLAKAEAKK